MPTADLRARLETVKRLRDEAEHDWEAVARPNQLEPPGEWAIWVALGGRGMGKSSALTQALRKRVREGRSRESALVGATAADARDVLVEGPAGVLSACTNAERPEFQPARRRLAWPNGAVTHIYSADEPERLRGPQHDFAIGDELRAWRYLRDALDNLLLGLRMGSDPRACFATTPSPHAELRKLLERPGTVVTRGTTYENLANLAPAFRERVVERYAGTRIGRQELEGEVLTDLEGALFKQSWLDEHRVDELPYGGLRRTVVALDPADGREEGDEQALCVVGVGHLDGGHLYVLKSEGHRTSPLQWLEHAVRLARDFDASLVIEKTFGGQPLLDLLEQVMGSTGIRAPYSLAGTQQGKLLRAEPVATLTEQGRVHLVGHHPELESQLVTFAGTPGERSPDRLDSFVHGARSLMSYTSSGSSGEMAAAVPYTSQPVQGGAVPWEGAVFSGEAEGVAIPLDSLRPLDAW